MRAGPPCRSTACSSATLSYALFNYWLGRFHPLTLFVVPPIYAAYFLVTLPALKLADSLVPAHGFSLQAVLWVCYEYFLKTQGFLAYSYGNLGYSQYRFLPSSRRPTLAGVWGVSALVVFPSALLGHALRTGLAALQVGLAHAPGGRGRVGRGLRRRPRLRPALAGRPSRRTAWKVALVQQNIDPWKGGVQAYARTRCAPAAAERPGARRRNPELVVWSETSFVPAIDWHTRYRADQQSYELVQAAARVPRRPDRALPDRQRRRAAEARAATGEEVRVDYNAAILFDRGRIVDTYRKLHLVPFTEHFPVERPAAAACGAGSQAADTHFWEKGDRWTRCSRRAG